MDITLAGIVAGLSILINQLLNWGASKVKQGKEEERQEVMRKEMEALKQENDKLEEKIVENVKALKQELNGELTEIHGRISRTQKDQVETSKEITHGINELLQRSAKIEGSMETMQKMYEIMMKAQSK